MMILGGTPVDSSEIDSRKRRKRDSALTEKWLIAAQAWKIVLIDNCSQIWGEETSVDETTLAFTLMRRIEARFLRLRVVSEMFVDLAKDLPATGFDDQHLLYEVEHFYSWANLKSQRNRSGYQFDEKSCLVHYFSLAKAPAYATVWQSSAARSACI